MRKSLAQKRAEAQQRQKEYDQLSLEEKLKRALERGHEGTKEVKKLRKQIAEQKEVTSVR